DLTPQLLRRGAVRLGLSQHLGGATLPEQVTNGRDQVCIGSISHRLFSPFAITLRRISLVPPRIDQDGETRIAVASSDSYGSSECRSGARPRCRATVSTDSCSKRVAI